jgi:tRNA-binding protein
MGTGGWMIEEPGGENSISAYQAFEIVNMRVGRVVRVEENSRARKPAYKLWIDFGAEMGIKTSSAQIVANYSTESLKDRLVIVQ